MRPGDIVDERFEIERIAGVGGMGTVYRALERVTGTPVALKVIRGGNREDALRLAREARLLADLNHPSVVRYLGQGCTATGEPFLVMEWLDGENLDQRLARAGLSIEESLTVVRHVAEALGAAHLRGFIHRDVKPANVFLMGGRVEDVRVLDFGIARSMRGTGIVTRTGMVVGTLGYMAPEQARAGAEVLDVRSDVFALGCVLFECLTGRPAFAGEGVMAVLMKILFEAAPRVSDLREDIPPVLDELVARMLSKDPAERPQDALEVARALERVHLTDELRHRAPAVRPASLTGSELRLVSVVVATARAPVDVAAQGLGEETRPLQGGVAEFIELETLLAPLGAQLERLPEGSMVATLVANGSASEQALRAARAALAMRAILPMAAISLATGRGMTQGQGQGTSLGEVIDRAIRLLTPAVEVPPAPRSSTHEGLDGPDGLGGPGGPGGPDGQDGQEGAEPIYIDGVTAGFLDARFGVSQDASGRFVLVGERRASPDPSRRLLGRPTRVVGRDRELAMLSAYLEECLQEPIARAVLVTGAPGMGKSRLGHEFLGRVREAEPTVEIWDAHGSPMSAGSPLGLLGQLLRRAFGVHEGEPLETRRAQVEARIQGCGLGDEQARVTEFIGELAGVPFEDRESVQLRAARSNPQLMNDQLRRAWTDFLAAETARHPVVLVLEDLHWGDMPSVQWLDAALRELKERPLFVLALARPDVHDRFPKLWFERGRQEIAVGELSRKASELLVRQVLGASAPAETVERVVRQAGGNVFFLEELIRAVAEGKEDALPETVLAMIQVRLERLDPEMRRVIRAASIFGESFWTGGLRILLGAERPTNYMESSLEGLEDRELLGRRSDSRFPEEKEYRFRHAFVREAAYAMLTEPDRVLGHRLTAEWLERVGEQDALVLAGHFERGRDAVKAAVYYERSATQALEVGDLGAAIERAERIVGAGAVGVQLARARQIQAEAHRWRSELVAAEERIEEAMRLSSRHSPSWYRAVAEAIEIAFMRGDQRRAVVLSEALWNANEGALAGTSELIAFATAAEMLPRVGQLAPALPFCRRLEEALLAEPGQAPLVAGSMRKALGMRDAALGDPATAHPTLLLAQADFERAGDVRQVQYAGLLVAMMAIRLGRCAEAEAALREGEVVMQRFGAPILVRWARYNLCNVLIMRGALAEAHDMIEEHVAHRRIHGNAVFLSKALWTFANALLGLGRLEEAEAAAREAAGLRGHTASMKATVARILLLRDRPEEALPLAQEALRIREQMGLNLEEKDGLAPLTLAEALLATGDRATACAVLAAGRERLLAIAGRIREDSWRHSFLAIEENARTLQLAEEYLGS